MSKNPPSDNSPSRSEGSPEETIDDIAPLDLVESSGLERGEAGSEFESSDAGSDANEEPAWSTDPESRMQRLEAVLMMAKEPLTSRKLSQLAGLEDGTQARTFIDQMNEHYDSVGRAFNVMRVAGGYQMLTRPQYSKWIRRQDHVPKPTRLSGPMLETVTVVAYRQPIIKAEIEAIRGVSCGEILRQLLESGLIKIAGRSPDLGRPYQYATTRAFLTRFGFNDLVDLPRAERLSGQGLPNWAVSDDNSTRPVSSSTPNAESFDPDQVSSDESFPLDTSAQEDSK